MLEDRPKSRFFDCTCTALDGSMKMNFPYEESDNACLSSLDDHRLFRGHSVQIRNQFRLEIFGRHGFVRCLCLPRHLRFWTIGFLGGRLDLERSFNWRECSDRLLSVQRPFLMDQAHDFNSNLLSNCSFKVRQRWPHWKSLGDSSTLCPRETPFVSRRTSAKSSSFEFEPLGKDFAFR